MSEQQFLIDGRPVPDLKVVELRKELELRSLPKSGNKKELVERLINYLREEQAEQQNRQQPPAIASPQQAQRSPTKSPPATTAAVPNMVAQYLAQQQLQLEAARRDADKLRASTSSNVELLPSAAEMTQPPPVVEELPKVGADKQGTETALEKSPPPRDVQQQASSDFIPEEPTSGEQQEVKDMTEANSEPKPEELTTVRRSSSRESSATEPGDEEEANEAKDAERDEEAPIDENVVEEEQYEEQATEKVQDDEQQLEEEDSFAEEKDTSTEFVPDEPAHKETKSNKQDNNLKTAISSASPQKQSSLPPGAAKQAMELDNEEEEDDEEREEPDDHGKRRRTPTSMDEDDEQPVKSAKVQDSHVSSATSEQSASAAVVQSSKEHPNQAGPQQVEAVIGGVEVVANEKPPQPVQISSAFGGRRRSSAAGMESSKAAGEPEITPDGFVRRRAASPARNAPSRWIHIRGLKRPYTQRALLELLGKFGTVDEGAFWIDSIKSNCIVTFETAEEARLARERLHNVVWPTASSEALCVEFSSEEKLNRRKAEDQAPAEPHPPMNHHNAQFRGAPAAPGGGLGLTIVVDNRAPDTSGPQVLIQHDKEQQREAENRKRKAEELEKSQKTLDELFKKTKTLPSLYYLPLSEAEAEKRQKAREAKQQRHHHSSHHHSSSGAAHNRDRDRANRDSNYSSRVGPSSGRHERERSRDRMRPSGSRR